MLLFRMDSQAILPEHSFLNYAVILIQYSLFVKKGRQWSWMWHRKHPTEMELLKIENHAETNDKYD